MENGKFHEYTSVDEFIKKALQQRAKRDADIDSEKVWEKFNKKYNIKRRRPIPD